MKIKNLFLLAALGLMASATLTSCDDILGEWSRPAPAAVTPSAIAVTSITLDAEATINVGETKTLTATVAPDNATDKTVSWISEDETIASVNASTGEVTGVAAGTAVITATANDGSGVKAQCTVTVKIPGLLSGVFTVNDSPLTKVQFSQGNLQATYDGSAWTWAFAENQWDCIGGRSSGGSEPQTGNNYINGNGTVSDNGTVDLFGWVGASNTTWTGAAIYGISNSGSAHINDYGTKTASDGETLRADWGKTIDPSGTTWRTLTSDEWNYLLNTRTVNGGTGSGNSYTLGQNVNGKLGLVIYPDDYTGGAYTTGSDWSTFESAGCVFLPAAGFRTDSSVSYVGSYGYYWSSSPESSPAGYASQVNFSSGSLDGPTYRERYYGHSVRLVHPAK